MSIPKRCLAGVTAAALGLAVCTGGGGGCVRVGSSTILAGQVTNGNDIELRDLKADPDNAMRLTGGWSGQIAQTGNSYIRVRYARGTPGGGTSSVSSSVGGREAEPLIQADDGPVHSVIHRDAGTLTLDGTVARGRGSGTTTFDADPAYVNEVSVQTGETVTPQRALELALVDLPLDFVKKV